MGRGRSPDPNAALAVSLFNDLLDANGWGSDDAWLAVAKLLMSCEVWDTNGWHHHRGFDFPIHLERNDYKLKKDGKPNRRCEDAIKIRDYIAVELGVPPHSVCSELRTFFRHPQISRLQPNNPRGHAFRSIVAETVRRFGDPELTVDEEVDPHELFPGFSFESRSQNPRIDITVHRGRLVVALISVRWTYRHDRVDLVEEARAYMPAAVTVNPRCKYYGATAEINTARLDKVISQTRAVNRSAALERLVHMKPELAREVINRDGRLVHMIGLNELADESFGWK